MCYFYVDKNIQNRRYEGWNNPFSAYFHKNLTVELESEESIQYVNQSATENAGDESPTGG